MKFYLEEKISKYPKYEATLLRKHFQNAKSRAEIDENFSKALAMVQEKRDTMSTVQAIPVAKVPATQVNENKGTEKQISGETIVKESGGTNQEASPSMYDGFVEVEADFDEDPISNEEMQAWMSQL